MDESVVMKFETYEDYLDSFITDTDRFYLEEVRKGRGKERKASFQTQILRRISVDFLTIAYLSCGLLKRWKCVIAKSYSRRKRK